MFFDVMERAHPRDRNQISEAVERAFWDEFDGVLLHPQVRALLANLTAVGRDAVVIEAESLLGQFHWAEDMKEARRWHIESRLRGMSSGRRGVISEGAVAAWEFLADYFLLQRATAEDIRNASRTKAAGESTAARLSRMDAYNRTHFSRTHLHVSFSTSMLDEYLAGRHHPQQLIRLAEYGRSRQALDAPVLSSPLSL
ncbi:MAG TPA: hypothetical protein VLK84_02695 [Longimicrobium sp.]|nr:hypothetical protein [Longimicrobium sp.]